MKQLARYFSVGAVAAGVDIALFWVFAGILGYPYLSTAFLTFIVATFVNYFLSVRVVFQSRVRFSRGREIALVFLVSAVGLVLNQSMLFLGVEQIDLPPIIAKCFATAIVFFWNYGLRSQYIFKQRRASAHRTDGFGRRG